MRIGSLLPLSLLVPASALGAEVFGEERFYLGDLHVHTGASGDGGSSDLEGSCDGGPANCLAVADVHETALEAGLDFWAVTDHINGMHTAGESFRSVVETVLSGSDADADYVTIPGAEVWFAFPHRKLGHKTLLLMGEDEDVASVTLEDLQFDHDNITIDDCSEIWDYAEALEDRFGSLLLLAHHPGLAMGMTTEWECHRGEAASWYSPAVEIYSNHGNSEHPDTHYDPLWAGTAEGGTVAEAMDPDDLALRLGFIGGTDSHDTRPGSVCTVDTQHTQHPYGGGLTVVALDEDEAFSRGAIYEAIQDRRSYATSGPLVPVSVSYVQHGVELGTMGSDLLLDPTEPLEIIVAIPEEWASQVLDIALIAPDVPDGKSEMTYDDDTSTWSGTLLPADFDAWVYPRVSLDGEAWYGRDGCDDGGTDREERLWISPSYLTLSLPAEPETDEVVDEPTSQPPGEDRAEVASVPEVSDRSWPDRPGLPELAPAASCSHAGGLVGWWALLAMAATRRRR